MKRVALIPARGGSKRLPRKNIVSFLGKPMLAHSIEVALDTRLFDEIYVSTEDDEIASIALSYGAKIHNRPVGLAGDNNTVAEVCTNFIESQSAAGVNWDQLIVLYAASPLRNAHDVKSVVHELEKGDCGVAMGVTAYSHYVHQAMTINEKGHANPVFPKWISEKRENIPKFCVSNGSIYAIDPEKFLENPSFYPKDLRVYEMPRERSVDIDTWDDLLFAEALALLPNKKR